jgi:hypothetical protein
MSPAAIAAETKEFYDLTTYLLNTYPTKRFILDNWEVHMCVCVCVCV